MRPWGQALLTFGWTVPLVWRRRWPVVVLAVVVPFGPLLGLVNAKGGVLSYVLAVILAAFTVGRRLRPDQTAEVGDLRDIEDTARQAMAEMRRLLGVLRAEGPAALAPQPGLDQLPRLVADTRAAGVPVHLRTEGERVPLPPGLDLAAYRVLQEALTNCRKHAAGAPTSVLIRYGTESVELRVENEGRGGVALTADGGHGLVGMRERVSLYGGTLTAGPRPGGGFSVHACLPRGNGVRG